MFKYPIKVVSQMTGLSVFVIRAWEKRYDVVTPSRTDTNRRLYSEKDIEKLKLLNEAVENGHSIGGIAKLSSEELKSVLKRKEKTPDPVEQDLTLQNYSDEDSFINKCIKAIRVYESKTLENILLNASSKMTQPQLIENLIVPLIYKVGDLWHTGELRVANEHMASVIIRSFLMNFIEQNTFLNNAPILISATPRGQEHELGAIIVGVVAASLGWKIIYLGTNLPAEEIAAASDAIKAKVVALSIVYPADDPQLKRDLVNLKKMLKPEVSIIVGGKAVTGYIDVLNEIGAAHIKDTRQLRIELETIREKKQN